MSQETFLPIGSIVILKGTTKKMMIISRIIAVPVEGTVYRFDYGACLYPEGLLGDSLMYFNNEDIRKIIHTGYSDEDNEMVLSDISETLSTTDIPKGNTMDLVQAQNEKE